MQNQSAAFSWLLNLVKVLVDSGSLKKMRADAMISVFEAQGLQQRRSELGPCFVLNVLSPYVFCGSALGSYFLRPCLFTEGISGHKRKNNN